jgi:hypothetical protein
MLAIRGHDGGAIAVLSFSKRIAPHRLFPAAARVAADVDEAAVLLCPVDQPVVGALAHVGDDRSAGQNGCLTFTLGFGPVHWPSSSTLVP